MRRGILLCAITAACFSMSAHVTNKKSILPIGKKDKAAKQVDILLLASLPGAGKSEVRKYLANLSPQECLNKYGIRETVQLDDFPYVHVMRCVSDELTKRGYEGMFFRSPVLPFKEPRDWGALMHLVNEDYDDLVKGRKPAPKSAAEWLFDRIDAAREKVGAPAELKKLKPALRKELVHALEGEAKKLLNDKLKTIAHGAKDKTVVIEFARGGPIDSPMPLPAPYGYQYSISQLSPQILEKASILYLWLTPAESRRKNLARANPNDPGSILNHCVPRAVMYADYGCDDIEWLLKNSDKPGTVKIEAHGSVYHLPLGRFDNRIDKTTFLRDDYAKWSASNVTRLQATLTKAFEPLVG